MSNKSKEVEKFSAQANNWWDATGSMHTLHEINPLRLEFIKDKVNLDGATVLDIGCGGGILTEALAKYGSIVTGIDASVELIDIAKQHAEQDSIKINYLHCRVEDSVEKFAKEKKFDVITCMELLEHVDDPAQVIQASTQLLKPGGTVIFSTLNRNLKSFLYAIVGAEYVLKLLPKGTHEYSKFIKPSELISTAKQYGLHAKYMNGITYNPIFKTYKLSSDTSVNYLIAMQKEL